jgi:hypothetical protein
MPDTITTKIDEFIRLAKARAIDGYTWTEFGDTLIDFLRLVVHLYDGVIAMTGAQKKAAALEGVGRLFDALVPNLLPWWAVLASPAIRSLVIALASGAIEQLLPLVRKAG